MSGVGAESLLFSLDCPMGGYPRRALLDVNTGRLRSQ
jgi:hypothetical protein